MYYRDANFTTPISESTQPQGKVEQQFEPQVVKQTLSQVTTASLQTTAKPLISKPATSTKPPADNKPPIISKDALQTYFHVVFSYCSGFIPCRSFAEKGTGMDDVKPINRWVIADDNAVGNALKFATIADKSKMGFFIIPGTVEKVGQARSSDILQMQTLLIDIDTGNTEEKLVLLTENIGTPTLIVESGGITAEGYKKLHLYWQLSKTVTGEEIQKLIELRYRIALAAGGDEHFKSAHQPIRVAGSIYHKGGAPRPKLVKIRTYEPVEYEFEELPAGVDRLEHYVAGLKSSMPGACISSSNGTHKNSFANNTDNTTNGSQSKNNPLDFNTDISQMLPIEQVLTAKVYEGGEGEHTRFNHISRVTGYWLYLHHKGIIGMNEAIEAIKGYNLSCMVPPWSEEKLEQTIKALWALHIQKYGEARKPLQIEETNDNDDSDSNDNDDDELLELVDPTAYAGAIIPEREWIIEDWLPRGCVTALYGDGGIGKTMLVQELMTCFATGKPFLGKQSATGTAWAVMCEDDLNELLRRQTRINSLYELDMQDLKKVRFVSRVSKDNLLITFNYGGVGQLTKFFKKLYRTVEAQKPDLVILDTASDLFGGNENARSEVRQFIQTACGKIATDMNTAVLLCAHPSESGILKGTGTGGSTAWNNTVRMRWYLKRPEGEQFNENHRVLTRVKSNYSATTGGQVYFELEDSVLKELSKEEVSELVNGQIIDRSNKTDKKLRIILDLIASEAGAGRIYTANQFAESFEGKAIDNHNLGSQRSIRGMLSVAATQGLIKFFQDPTIYGLPIKQSAYGYLCRANTMLKVGETIDPETGRVKAKHVKIVPTHYKCSANGNLMPIQDTCTQDAQNTREQE